MVVGGSLPTIFLIASILRIKPNVRPSARNKDAEVLFIVHVGIIM